MSDSGSNGALPAGWAELPVSDVGAVRLGRQRSPDQHTGEFSTKYLRAANITETGLDLSEVLEMDFTPEERAIYALEAGDVLLAEGSGSPSHVGRPAIWRDELPLCCFQNTVIRFRAHATTPEYALVVFRHYARSGRFAGTARGMGVLHLGRRRFGDIPFPLPPGSEQQRIVLAVDQRMQDLGAANSALHSALAASIEHDRAVLAAAVAGELLRSAAGRTTSRAASDVDQITAPTQGLSSDLPAGWSCITVEEAGELTLGKTLGGRQRDGAVSRPYLRTANVREDVLDLSDVKQMPLTDDEFERYRLHPADILLTEASGSPDQVGRPAMYQGDPPDVGFQNALIRFRARRDVEPGWALLVFRHYFHSGTFQRVARGSTSLTHLSRSRLASLSFPLPPVDEQCAILAEAGRRLTAAKQQRELTERALGRVAHLRDEVLAAAVSGALVEQSPADEPADKMLLRLGPPPPDRSANVTPVTPPRLDATTPTRTAGGATQPLGDRIVRAVEHADGPISLPDLCRALNLDLNDVTAIEALYVALRAELGTRVRPSSTDTEHATLELGDDATG
jgi:hypothetical protein